MDTRHARGLFVPGQVGSRHHPVFMTTPQLDRPWILNGAAVRVSMVGFDDGAQQARILDGAPANVINTDLTGAVDLTSARVLKENLLIQFEGTKKGAAFDIPDKVARLMLDSPVNPNGRPNSDVVHPWANAMDVTRRPRDVWIIDFGAEMPLEEAALYELPFEYVETHVKPKYGHTRKAWWLHERVRRCAARSPGCRASYVHPGTPSTAFLSG